MTKTPEEEREEALNTLIKGGLKPLATENICLIENGYLKLGNELMNPTEISSLAAEAKMVRETRLWKIFQETIRFEAFRTMSQSSNMEQMRPGKWMLHNLDSMNGVLSAIITLNDKLPPKSVIPKKSVSNPKPSGNIQS